MAFSLAGETNVIAPVNSKDKLVYGKIDSADQIAWDFESTHHFTKKLVLSDD